MKGADSDERRMRQGVVVDNVNFYTKGVDDEYYCTNITPVMSNRRYVTKKERMKTIAKWKFSVEFIIANYPRIKFANVVLDELLQAEEELSHYDDDDLIFPQKCVAPSVRTLDRKLKSDVSSLRQKVRHVYNIPKNKFSLSKI